MGSFSNGFFVVLGGMVAFLFIIVLIVVIVFYSLKTGWAQSLAKDTLKRAIGL